VFYCTLVDRKIVMLHQFVKKTDKTPFRELAIARKRMKEWKNVDAYFESFQSMTRQKSA
jgi:phage-related protein